MYWTQEVVLKKTHLKTPHRVAYRESKANGMKKNAQIGGFNQITTYPNEQRERSQHLGCMCWYIPKSCGMRPPIWKLPKVAGSLGPYIWDATCRNQPTHDLTPGARLVRSKGIFVPML